MFIFIERYNIRWFDLFLLFNPSSMSTTSPPHNRSRSEEEDDPVDRMISRTGCGELHYAVQECMAEHQDWRKCQSQVQTFKDCMTSFQNSRKEQLNKRQQDSAKSAHNWTLTMGLINVNDVHSCSVSCKFMFCHKCIVFLRIFSTFYFEWYWLKHN